MLEVFKSYLLLTNLTEAPHTTTSAFGLGMAHIGDINKDGYQDFAIGAPYENDYKGNYARERQKIFRITTFNITLDNDNHLIKPVTNEDI